MRRHQRLPVELGTGVSRRVHIPVGYGLKAQHEAAGAAPNIPSMVHRRWKACFSPALYRARNRIERFFNRIKHFRRIATRYEKHAANFLAMLKFAATQLWMRHNEPMT
jgi:transposase